MDNNKKYNSEQEPNEGQIKYTQQSNFKVEYYRSFIDRRFVFILWLRA